MAAPTQIPKSVYSGKPTTSSVAIVTGVPANKAWLLTILACNDTSVDAALELRRKLSGGSEMTMYSSSRNIPAGMTVPIPAIVLETGDELFALQVTSDAIVVHVDALEVPTA